MSVCVLLLASFLALAVATATNLKTSIRAPASQAVIDELRQKIADNGGCNINVCFAIDGSASVRQSGFDAEKQFIFDVEAIINFNRAIGLAATQFGATNSPISSLTSDANGFRLALNGATFLNGGATNIRDGISFCVAELLKSTSGPKKIVVLTDGRANRGGDPAPLADLFRAIGGEVCAVGVGFQDVSSLLAIAGGDTERVLTVDDFFRLADILEDLIAQVCGF